MHRTLEEEFKDWKNSPWVKLHSWLRLASAPLCGYHGYRRNDSLGWGIAWFALGGMFPLLAPTIAVAEGFGQPAFARVALGRKAKKRLGSTESLTPAQRAYVELYAQDVRNDPNSYKAEVRANPTDWALRHIDGLDDGDVKRLTRELRAEMKMVARLTRGLGAQLAGRSNSFTVDRGNYRVLVAPDRYRGGFSAKLISEGIGTIMEPNDTSARRAIDRLVRELRLDKDNQHDKRLAREIAAKAKQL